MSWGGEQESGGKKLPPKEKRRISSAELMGEGREVLIEHRGEVYSLRMTSNGKLILTK